MRIHKRIGFLILAGAMFFCSCQKKQDTRELVFPNTTWEMEYEEVMEALGVTEQDVKFVRNEGSEKGFVLEEQELFGEQTWRINFHFYDFSGDNDYKLVSIEASYPDDADMDHVLEEMQKVYGTPDEDVKFYEGYSMFDTLSPYKPSDPDKVVSWAKGSVAELIPKEKEADFRDAWMFYQPRLNEENWDTFHKDSRTVRITWNTDSSHRVEFDNSNQRIYDTIHDRLSDGTAERKQQARGENSGG